jgi:hypothetical protein
MYLIRQKKSDVSHRTKPIFRITFIALRIEHGSESDRGR